MMKKHSLLLLSVVLALICLAIVGAWVVPGPGSALAAPQGTTWYVDADNGDDSFDCLSLLTACRTVSEAASRAIDADLVQIASGVYTDSLDISKELILIGAGPDDTFLDGQGDHRVLQASSSSGLTLTDLAIRNGHVMGANGGGIYNLGTLTLDNVRVYSNTTDNSGSGIFNNGDLTLEDSQVLSNTSEGVGGGIYSYYQGVVTITESLIAGNSGNQGGGLYNLGVLDLENVIVRSNSAAVFGGGLTIFGGAANLMNVTVSQNQTPGYGGGIVNNLGALTLTNVTVSGNTADNYSGIANISANAETTVLNTTIGNNFISGSAVRYGGVGNISNAIIQFKNTIIANNEGRNCLVSGDWTSQGHNLSSDNYCDFSGPGDLMNTDPLLAPLADYGGSMRTHALFPSSPAIDNGENAGCPTWDQRGVSRPFDGDSDGIATCDIGAYEARNQITVNDITLNEGDIGTTDAVFTVLLSPTSTQMITVGYATADGTAIAGSDYQAISGTLTFDPGEGTQVVNVMIDGDTDDEPDETFTLNLSNGINADIIDPEGVATIVDDDGLSSLTIMDTTVAEGNSGTTGGEFTVTLSPLASQVITVDYVTIDGTAVAGGDYAAISDMLTFNPGETMKVINVDIYGDIVDEGDSEMFSISLTNAANANIADGLATGQINDDDTARVSLGSVISVTEGDGGTAPAVFTVTLSTPTDFPVTVDYATSSGTGGSFATPGIDFEGISGTLSFDPGETLKTISVQVIGDLEDEKDEYFSVRLSNAQPISIYINSSIGYILDDENRVYLPLVVH